MQTITCKKCNKEYAEEEYYCPYCEEVNNRILNNYYITDLANKINFKKTINPSSNKIKTLEESLIEAIDKKHNELIYSYHFVLNVVQTNSYILKYAPVELTSNRDFIKECIKFDNLSIKYASNEIKSDKEFILKLLLNNKVRTIEFFTFISDELKKDKEFMEKTLKYNLNFLYFFPEQLLNNRDYIKELIIGRGEIIKPLNLRTSNKYKDDKEIALNALSYPTEEYKENPIYANYGGLDSFSDRLKDDKDVVLASVKIKPASFKFASDRLKNDKDFIRECIQTINKYNYERMVETSKDIEIMHYASQNLKDDKEFILGLKDIAPDAEYWYEILHSERMNDNNPFKANNPFKEIEDSSTELNSISLDDMISEIDNRIQKIEEDNNNSEQ